MSEKQICPRAGLHIQYPFVWLECLGSGLPLVELGVISRNVAFPLACQAECILEFVIKYFGCSICVSCFIPSSVTCRVDYIITDFKAHNKIKP